MLALALLPWTACTSPPTHDTSSPVDSDSHAVADFVTIPAGTFDIGSTPGQPDFEYGVHTVTLTHAYSVGVTEVTQGQFVARMGYDPASFTECDALGPDNCPVEQVSWDQSAAYANAVSVAAGLQECYTCTGSETDVRCEVAVNPYECAGYRLLTEVEWEGAARCGTDTRYAGSNTSTDVAWTLENSDESTHAAAGLAPNACGLYDMSGNVWEWTQDGYADYPLGDMTDPVGAETGADRVFRGGAWGADAFNATVSFRSFASPDFAYAYFGLRLARSMP